MKMQHIRYEPPQYLVEPLGDQESLPLYAVRREGYVVVDAPVMGWPPYTAIIRWRDATYLARLPLRECAQHRVDQTPELTLYADFIMADWAEGDEHWRWVLTTPVPEIVEWARLRDYLAL